MHPRCCMALMVLLCCGCGVAGLRTEVSPATVPPRPLRTLLSGHQAVKRRDDSDGIACCAAPPQYVFVAALEENENDIFRLPAIDSPLTGEDRWTIDQRQRDNFIDAPAARQTHDEFSAEIARLPDLDLPAGDFHTQPAIDEIEETVPGDAQPSWTARTGGYLFAWGQDVRADHINFYSRNNLFPLAMVFGAGATLANTGWDEGIQDALRENLVYTPSDEYSEFIHNHKLLGEGSFLLPAYFAIAVVGQGLTDEPLAPLAGAWADRSLRAIVVGAPPLVVLQLASGGSRPDETGHGSHWRPLHDNNGVSGHAFVGAIPLITAARMSQGRWLKVFFYSASLLPALSRITDNAHYPSQAMIGWTLAYVATGAVDQTDHGEGSFALAPWTNGDATGIGCLVSW